MKNNANIQQRGNTIALVISLVIAAIMIAALILFT